MVLRTIGGREMIVVPNPDGGEWAVTHSRMIAIAEYGINEMKDKVVHHKNYCTLDDTRENLVPLTQTQHRTLHGIESGPQCEEGVIDPEDDEYLERLADCSGRRY